MFVYVVGNQCNSICFYLHRKVECIIINFVRWFRLRPGKAQRGSGYARQKTQRGSGYARQQHSTVNGMYNLILVRHGRSEWNDLNLFTGWHDCPLMEIGRQEARDAVPLLAEANLLPDILHTSLLQRAIEDRRDHSRRA